MDLFPRTVTTRTLLSAWAAFLLPVLLMIAVMVVVAATLHDLPDAVVSWFVPVGSVGVAAALRWVLRDWSAAELGFRNPGRRGLHLLWQVPVTLTVAVLFTAVVGQGVGLAPADATDSPGDADTPTAALVLLTCYLVLGPVVEEILVRRMTMPWVEERLLRRTGRRKVAAVGAVLFSSVVFAMLHVVAPVMLWTFFLGAGCAVLTRVHRSVWGGLGPHVTVNVIAVTALFPMLLDLSWT